MAKSIIMLWTKMLHHCVVQIILNALTTLSEKFVVNRPYIDCHRIYLFNFFFFLLMMHTMNICTDCKVASMHREFSTTSALKVLTFQNQVWVAYVRNILLGYALAAVFDQTLHHSNIVLHDD